MAEVLDLAVPLEAPGKKEVEGSLTSVGWFVPQDTKFNPAAIAKTLIPNLGTIVRPPLVF